jgi:hypothetical protein
MPLDAIVPVLITSVIQWVAKHHEEIIPATTTEFLNDVFTQGGLENIVKQIGNTVIWHRPDGASRIIGILDQLDSRIDGLEIPAPGLQTGLAGLKNISMVTLGFSGISVALLASQFVFLARRLTQIQKEVKRIQLKIDQTIEAHLQAGLDFLQAADATIGDEQIRNYRDALGRARDAGHFFRSQAVSPDIHEEQLSLIQYYSRKYFLALSIELGSLLGLDRTDEVRTRLNVEESNLKAVATQVFKKTLALDVDSYLVPELRDVVTLENISGLFEQAQHLGCIPRDTRISPADVFEANRKSIYSSNYLSRAVSSKFNNFRREAAQKLQAAQGTFEEVTRLLSWREAVRYIAQNGRSPTEVARELRQFRDKLETPTDSSPFVAYSLSPKEA